MLQIIPRAPQLSELFRQQGIWQNCFRLIMHTNWINPIQFSDGSQVVWQIDQLSGPFWNHWRKGSDSQGHFDNHLINHPCFTPLQIKFATFDVITRCKSVDFPIRTAEILYPIMEGILRKEMKENENAVSIPSLIICFTIYCRFVSSVFGFPTWFSRKIQSKSRMTPREESNKVCMDLSSPSNARQMQRDLQLLWNWIPTQKMQGVKRRRRTF